MSWKSEVQVLLLLIILLVIIALTVIKIHNIVRFESGLEDTEVLRGMWSKMYQVLFQPVKWPLLMGVYVGVGFRYTLEILFNTLLQIADVGGPPRQASTLAISLVCMAFGAFSAIITYRFVGGCHPERCLAGILGASLLLYGLRLWTQPFPFSPISTVLWVLGICLVTVLCGMSAMNWALPLDSQLLELKSPTSVPKLWWGWCIPLVLLSACTEIVHTKLDSQHYLERICLSFSDLMLLVCCAFISTWCTNSSVMNGDYHWKWQCILVVGIPVSLFELGAFGYDWAFRDVPLATNLRRKFIISIVSGASSLLGSIFYLGVVAKYASTALDPGYEGQSELLEDEDEYEV